MSKCDMKGGRRTRKNRRQRKPTKTQKRKVRFNLRKNKTRSIPKIRRRNRQRGGNLLPQTLSNIVRGRENSIVNTINTLKGTPLAPSPYPTQDHPIDQDAML